MPWGFIALLLGSAVGWFVATLHESLYDISVRIAVSDANALEDLPKYLNHPQRLTPIVSDLRLPMSSKQLAARLRVVVTDETVTLFFRTGDFVTGREVVRLLVTEARGRLVSAAQEKERTLSVEIQELEGLFRLRREAAEPSKGWALALEHAPFQEHPIYGRSDEWFRGLGYARERLARLRDQLHQLSVTAVPQLRTQRLSSWGLGLQRGLTAISFGLLSVFAVSWGLSGERLRIMAESHAGP